MKINKLQTEQIITTNGFLGIRPLSSAELKINEIIDYLAEREEATYTTDPGTKKIDSKDFYQVPGQLAPSIAVVSPKPYKCCDRHNEDCGLKTTLQTENCYVCCLNCPHCIDR